MRSQCLSVEAKLRDKKFVCCLWWRLHKKVCEIVGGQNVNNLNFAFVESFANVVVLSVNMLAVLKSVLLWIL